jgi:membrane dipeptidase
LRAGLLAGAGAVFAPMVNRGRLRFAQGLEVSARAVELVGRSTVIDMLGLLTLDWPKLYSWQRRPETFGDADLALLRASGVNVFHPAVEPNSPQPHAAALRWMSGWSSLLSRHPEAFTRISNAADLARSRREEKLGIVLGFQNSDHFRNASDVAAFHRLGQRVSQLTYNGRNRLGSGCQDPRDAGLTSFGAEVVTAMNRVGMAIDVSHCSDRTALDTFAASRQPVLITHSNCRAIAPHPRCKSDRVIRAMAATGGVMGITVIPAFVRLDRAATLDDLLDHFDHVARVAGIEHVGLGSDADVDALDPATRRLRPRYGIQGLLLARRTFELTEGLLRRGYSDRDVELVLGGNFQRALGTIWGMA